MQTICLFFSPIVFFSSLFRSKMKMWQKKDMEPLRNKKKIEDLAQRQQFLRYLKSNPIFKTLRDKHGAIDRALDHLGYKSVYAEVPGVKDCRNYSVPVTQKNTVTQSGGASQIDKKAAVTAIKAVQQEVDRLRQLLGDK